MLKLCLAVILLGIVTQINCENLPVFIWGQKTPTFLPALNRLNSEEFVTLIKSQTDESNGLTLVFVENNLSVEDLSQCKLKSQTCFENLRKIEQKTYLTSVEDPVTALKSSYAVDKQSNILLGNEGDLSDKITGADGQVIFIYMDDVEDNKDFATHDALINKIYNSVAAKYSNVLAVYTAQHPSFAYSQLRRKTRDVQPKQSGESEQRVFVNDKLLIALKEVQILAKDATTPKIISANLFTLELNQTGTEDAPAMRAILRHMEDSIDMSITLSAGNWKVAEWNYNSEKFYSEHQVKAPRVFSFSCGNLEVRDIKTRIYLVDFQIQPEFDSVEKITAFSTSQDCVGFFSAGIWGGLFVIIILLSILSYGLTAIMDIKTMDRFDDPKGKTIIINAAE